MVLPCLLPSSPYLGTDLTQDEEPAAVIIKLEEIDCSDYEGDPDDYYESDPLTPTQTTTTTTTTHTRIRKQTLAIRQADDNHPQPPSSNHSHSSYARCHLCAKTYASQRSLRSHISLVHLNMRHTHTCPTCGRMYPKQYLLKRHIRDYHSNVEPCSSCGKILSNRILWAKHEARDCHVKWDEDKLKRMGLNMKICSAKGCGKLFATNRGFQGHLQRHSKGKRISKRRRDSYNCSICYKTFPTNCNRRRHEANVHSFTRGNSPVIERALYCERVGDCKLRIRKQKIIGL